jgi:hypothetical protein
MALAPNPSAVGNAFTAWPSRATGLKMKARRKVRLMLLGMTAIALPALIMVSVRKIDLNKTEEKVR